MSKNGVNTSCGRTPRINPAQVQRLMSQGQANLPYTSNGVKWLLSRVKSRLNHLTRIEYKAAHNSLEGESRDYNTSQIYIAALNTDYITNQI